MIFLWSTVAWLRSLMRRYFAGQGELKHCAPTEGCGGPQAPAMGLDDGSADGQSHAGALRLGGEEGIEVTFEFLMAGDKHKARASVIARRF